MNRREPRFAVYQASGTFSAARAGHPVRSGARIRRANAPLVAVLGIAIVAATMTTGAFAPKIRYIAVGDSYTIGEGASPNEAWPNLLVQHLTREGVAIDLIANPSRTGWTTKDVIDKELPIFRDLKPDFGTLLIGVNDWVQGVDEDTFRHRFTFIIDQMLEVLGNRNRLLVITIPDFGVTPQGSHYSRGRNISEGINAFNRIVLDEAQKRGLRVVDLFERSKKMADDPSLVAPDGLHPSANEYAEWEKLIYPAALELLSH